MSKHEADGAWSWSNGLASAYLLPEYHRNIRATLTSDSKAA